MAVLDVVDALLDRLVAAHVEGKQRQGLAERVACCLHELVLLLQVPHGGDDWCEQTEKFDLLEIIVKHFNNPFKENKSKFSELSSTNVNIF